MFSSFTPGQACPAGGFYGQFSTLDNAYAGPSHDRFVAQGNPFPEALPGHHYRYGGVSLQVSTTEHFAAFSPIHQTAWDPNNPVTAG
jgi:hypothetical protein